ncbi:DUF6602 domain-containing protein [Pseudomonas fluorescens]|uniref:DUF6602 domain-containing protein n=1 Tax=Pseudomonas fluorescens TaxID=294 RepID=A0A423M8G2_PSEFL|nr:DUF6602 domain-containing protein [Pseudomonas fluorescens]RON79119.1 hypothetical protein BK670_16525 [Pseudomonas fluorescens]
MELKISDVCICANDNWDSIVTYRVREINKDAYVLEPASDPFSGKNLRAVPVSERGALWIYPFSLFSHERYRALAESMHTIGDLVCALLGKHKDLPLEELISLMIKHKDKYKFRDEHAPWILRCLVAAKKIVAKQKGKAVVLSLSPAQSAREKQRKFSATIASELASLSERVRFIIDHGPTVGTYRENLLQNSLRKHLPERYHVATGFIYGLKKQIDILIYDRIDYAPVFREGDLVIVPPESVRAVIEVKTSLTAENLVSALELLDLASYFDDKEPPFFKGIFAFESPLKSHVLYEKIAKFYTDWNLQSQGGPGEMISRPFQHLTCACVNNKTFAYTRYTRNENGRLVPVLCSKNSATDLESQSSFFMQSLLSHLKFGGMKPFKMDYMGRMLGEDTYSEDIKDLRAGDDSWGAYFGFDEGDEEEIAVEEMEKLIIGAQRWLDGEDNFDA